MAIDLQDLHLLIHSLAIVETIAKADSIQSWIDAPVNDSGGCQPQIVAIGMRLWRYLSNPSIVLA